MNCDDPCCTCHRPEDAEWKSGLKTSESPVELLLFGAFVAAAAATDCVHRKGAPVGWDDGEFGIYGEDFDVFPQYKQFGYRLDFALIGYGVKIAVEVDGHAFHERTKEQATHDKARDRMLQSVGWRVLRYTGSEVHSDAHRCVSEALWILRKFASR